MTAYFDFIYLDRRVSAPTDLDREFFSFDVGSLDAPDVLPAGSTKASAWRGCEPFHATSFTYRGL